MRPESRLRRLCLPGLLAGALLGPAGGAVAGAEPVHTPALAFTVPGRDGKVVALTAHPGRITCVAFWASWCPDCARVLQRLEKRLEQRTRTAAQPPVDVLAISVDQRPADAAAWLQDHPLSVPVGFDEAQRVPRLFEIDTLPAVVEIGPDGQILHRLGAAELAGRSRPARAGAQGRGGSASACAG